MAEALTLVLVGGGLLVNGPHVQGSMDSHEGDRAFGQHFDAGGNHAAG